MMTRTVYGIVFMLLFIQCATYKQLKPKPELSPQEQGYIELKKDKNYFDLAKNKRYFIEFPAAPTDNFYLVLKIKEKGKIDQFLVKQLLKNRVYDKKIADETPDPANLSVYAIGTAAPQYYWLIDGVREDVVLQLDYRYAPQWRFKFENKYEEFKTTSRANRFDRAIYNELGVSFHFGDFQFQRAIDSLGRTLGILKNVEKELLAIESIFPTDIKNSQDQAYQNYVELKSSVQEEILFQSNYLLVLDFFNHEAQTHDNTAALLDRMDEFASFFNQSDKLPEPIVLEARKLLGRRLGEVVPYYDKLIATKKESSVMDPQVYNLGGLIGVAVVYEASGMPIPEDFRLLKLFVDQYNERAASVKTSHEKLKNTQNVVTQHEEMPTNSFFPDIVGQLKQLEGKSPKPFGAEVGKYQTYPCTEKLNGDLNQFAQLLEGMITQYTTAGRIVPELNAFKEQRDYRSMLVLLKQHRHLGFLVNKYKGIDRLSVEEQARGVRGQIESGNWSLSESKLRELHLDNNFLDPSAIQPLKEAAVRDLEDTLYVKVDALSRSRVQRFITENLSTVGDVDSLYADSVFTPVYNLTFSSESRSDLVQKRNNLYAHLQQMKELDFPAQAIKALYSQFVQNPDNDGVAKARAIVTHGTYYKGKDQSTKLAVAECDPNSAKWIVKPTEYRRVFVLPTTSNKSRDNVYMVRFNIRIPSDATFPVYDVNIKLPKEIAQKAETVQWYDKITLNKKPLKNEGRFTISAPTAANNYECQITPVQVDKAQSNILEITFKHPTFKPHIISVMVQKPLIKKN